VTRLVVAGICVAALTASVSACASSPAPARASTDRATFGSIDGPGWEFSYPDAVDVAGNRVWVGNFSGSVTEVNAATGALIRVISGGRYDLYEPSAITTRGNTVWIANSYFNGDGTNTTSVTEINATTGALIRVITARRYQLDWPTGIATTGDRVWVANGASVTEVNATTGALIRVITARRYQLNGLVGIAATGKTVWVANSGGNDQTVTEISATTGALIRAGSSSSLPYMAFAMTADRYGAWVVTNDTGGKGGGVPEGVVAEFSATTGKLARALSQPVLANSNGGGAISADGGYIWVTGTNFYDGAGWLAKFNAATGALVLQVIAGDPGPATD
jgi:DNA-binding beta-propeller fold protein YncE